MSPCILLLTCADQKEADKIAQQLLTKRLAACVKSISTKSAYRWKGKIEKASEVLLIIDSFDKYFDEIQLLVQELHSYETFNLSMVTITKTTDDIMTWLAEEIS